MSESSSAGFNRPIGPEEEKHQRYTADGVVPASGLAGRRDASFVAAQDQQDDDERGRQILPGPVNKTLAGRAALAEALSPSGEAGSDPELTPAVPDASPEGPSGSPQDAAPSQALLGRRRPKPPAAP